MSEYLYAPIQWKDQIRVENKEYSKEEIIRREKENNEISKPKRKTAKGYLVQFDNDGAYGYMVFKGDTIDGIKERFGVKQSDLENVNYWHEVHENGQYEDSVGIFWLQEGDIVYLPEYYTPKNGTLFYSYDRNTNTGIKVKKEQGKYEKNFLGENLTYKYFKDRLKEFADQFDDNTRTYSFDLSGSISISAQLSVFFYLGLDGKFGASIASGNTRSLGVNSYWSIGGNAGFGNKSVANIGVSGEYKQSLGMLEALNGSYTSIKHFMAFLDLNMYSFMLQNEWTVPLYKMGIDDEYWNHVMSEEGDVYHELSKGYVRAVNTSYVGQIEGGLKGVGGFNVGHQSVSVENYSVPQIISFDEVKAYSKIKSNDQLKKYNKEDVSNKIYATLKVGDGAECKFSYDTVESSLNSNNLGEYFNISLTINEYDISTNTNGEKDSNGVKTVYNFFNDVMTKYKSENSETVLDWTKQFEKNSTELKDEVKWNNRSIAHEEAKEEKRVAERKLEKQQTQQKIDTSNEVAERNTAKSERATNPSKKNKYIEKAERAKQKSADQTLLQQQQERKAKIESENSKRKTESLKLKNKIREKKIEKIEKFEKLFNEKFKDLRDKKLKATASTSNKEYTKIDVSFQLLPGDFKLHYMRVTTGRAFSADATVGKAGYDVSGKVQGNYEVEILEMMGENTIAYASLVYNSIYKEGIKRLNGDKKKEYDSFANNILGDIQKGDSNRILSMVHHKYIQDLGKYNSTIHDYYFGQIMGGILHNFEMGSIYNNTFEMSKWPPNKQKNFVRAVDYIKENISAEKYPSLILAYAEQMKSYGKTGAMDRLREIILGEETANKQWSKFKDTRGQVRASDNLLTWKGLSQAGVEKTTGFDEIRITKDQLKKIAVNFGVKVKTAVECYAEDVPSEQATWNDCPIDDLSPGQAHLYLGDIKDIVKYIQGNKDKKDQKTLKISDFMKSLLNDDYDTNKIDLSVFEKDILFPLLIENIVYGKQLPKN
ncbi:hypothetical protein AVL50_29885 [Flammeovirga sp. SJP92]|nr:hypothetical protein AVL50_29885 [Flammeovirga sp. SJP92]